jgi:hypothetical protein
MLQIISAEIIKSEFLRVLAGRHNALFTILPDGDEHKEKGS